MRWGWQRTGRAQAGHRERGSATIWAVLALALVMSVGLAAAGLSAAVVARHRASAAADLAALAAADELARGATNACDRADQIARAQGATLTACTVAHEVADVMVSVRVPGPLSFGLVATMRARAGPPTMQHA